MTSDKGTLGFRIRVRIPMEKPTGRKPRVVISKEHFDELYTHQRLTVEEISNQTGVPRTTLNRWRKEWGIEKIQRHESFVGRRNGSLVVEREETSGKRGSPTLFHCRCDCGVSHTIQKNNWERTKSCGCLRLPDRTGQKFHQLTVLGIERRFKGNGYRCLCDCGNQIVLDSSKLGVQKSCGCLRQVFLEKGTIFDRWTVLERIPRIFPQGGKNGFHYRCVCICGTEKEISGSSLKSGMTRSCGCLRDDLSRLPSGESARNGIFHGYKKNALKRNLDFKLSLEEATLLFERDCHYCNQPPREVSRKNCFGTYTCNGIDRPDNKQGYISGNVVTCCTQCNLAKSTLSLDAFFKWSSRIVSSQNWEKLDYCAQETLVPERNSKVSRYKASAKARGLLFSLSDNFARFLFQQPCAYCGEEKSNGIDRIDNNLHYSPENVVPCCKWCNRGKNNWTLEEFLGWAERLRNYQNQINSPSTK